MKALVTGCAGFIGSHLCETILKQNLFTTVIGIDNLNSYYDISIKNQNLEILKKYDNFTFLEEDIIDTKSISEYKPNVIFHLAAAAGVRYSIDSPKHYCRVNIEGMINLLEQAKDLDCLSKFIFASSSSVYGNNKKSYFNENDSTNCINSPYAASKKTMEIYSQVYNQIYGINIIALRLFTVYGPRGRPDMAPYKFLNSIKNNIPINKFGDGESYRDYTYIDDIISGIINSYTKNLIGFNIYNLASGNSITLNRFIEICEKVCNKKVIINQLDKQLGDVLGTQADISKAKKELEYEPKVTVKDGIQNMYNCI